MRVPGQRSRGLQNCFTCEGDAASHRSGCMRNRLGCCENSLLTAKRSAAIEKSLGQVTLITGQVKARPNLQIKKKCSRVTDVVKRRRKALIYRRFCAVGGDDKGGRRWQVWRTSELERWSRYGRLCRPQHTTKESSTFTANTMEAPFVRCSMPQLR